MAVPEVANIYPAVGHTGGEAMIRILGQGFKRSPDPTTLTHDDPAPGPTVEVLFDNVPAPYVGVVGASELFVKTPASPLSATTGSGAGLVDVIVRNLDADGDPIPGETVTIADGFRYEYTKLTSAGTLVRVVRKLIVEMRRQVIPNVVYAPHTDYDADTADGLNITEFASLPSLALVGPSIKRSAVSTTNEREYINTGREIVLRREPYKADLTFELIGVADKTWTFLNLEEETMAFLDRIAYLRIAADPTDPDTDYYEYEVSVPTEGAPSISSGSDDANLRSFSLKFVVKGFPVVGLASFPDTSVGALEVTYPIGGDVDDISLVFEQL